MKPLTGLLSELAGAGLAQSNPSLYSTLVGILNLDVAALDGDSKLVADPFEFVLDSNTGLYLRNTDQSGNAEFLFRVGVNGKIYERFRTIALGDWIDYTPVWTSTAGPAPTMGASTLSGAYSLVGNNCSFYAILTLGAGFAFGGGAQALSLPVPIISPLAVFTGIASLAGVNYTPTFLNGSTTTIIPFTNAAPNAIYTALVPAAWAANDILFVMGSYRS